MDRRTIVLVCTAVLAGASAVFAQSAPGESLTNIQKAVACQSPPILENEPVDAVRIVGSQDVVYRETFGSPEVLVLSAGTAKDVKVNNVYYVRRLLRGAETLRDKVPHTVITSGWVRVVAATDSMALVSPEHACSDIRVGDYLEPFVAPTVQESGALTPLVQSELNFDLYSKVMHGELDRRSVGTNEFATIEHGVDRNIRVGTRFAVYRDLHLDKNPLKRIGEAIAMAVGPSLTLVRVTSARDAIFTSDVMVPRTADGVTHEPPPPPETPSLLADCRNEGRVPPQNPRCGDSARR
jgi:hypothetical protein